MWDGLLDYGRLEWQHTLQKIERKLTNEASLLEAFDKVWGPHHVICAKDELKVWWCYQAPYTLIGVSFGRCVVLCARVGCPPGLVVYWFSFCNGFSICA